MSSVQVASRCSRCSTLVTFAASIRGGVDGYRMYQLWFTFNRNRRCTLQVHRKFQPSSYILRIHAMAGAVVSSNGL